MTNILHRGHREIIWKLSELSYRGGPHEFAEDVKTAIVDYVLDELFLTLRLMSSKIDDIDRLLIIRFGIDRNRSIGIRQGCFRLAAVLAYMRVKADIPRGGVRLAKKFQYVQSLVGSMTSRVNEVQKTLLSSTGVLEDERAMVEAKNVKRLTQLAFFFIPLTFVAGLFGMNVMVSTSRCLVQRDLTAVIC